MNESMKPNIGDTRMNIHGNNNGYYVATPKGNKIYPSVGVTSLQECKRWVAENTREAEPDPTEVNLNKLSESADLMSDISEIDWLVYSIMDSVARLKHHRPNHPIVIAIRALLESTEQ